MNIKFIIIFSLLSLVNVVFATFKSLVTIKGGKWAAALANAGYFAFYNIMLIFTVADFPMWMKCIITFGSNLIGVLLVKFIEEKSAKEKLWKFEATFAIENLDNINHLLKEIPHNYIEVGKWVIFNIYCATCEQSELVTEICKLHHGKYFVTETKM